MAEIEILSSKDINMGGDNIATVSEIKTTDGIISTKVQFSQPEAAATQQWLSALEKKFPVDYAVLKTIGAFTVLGAHGETICNILTGHDKGGDDASPPSPPTGGKPTKGGPHTPLIPGNSNDDARYRTMTGQTGRTPILPRSK